MCLTIEKAKRRSQRSKRETQNAENFKGMMSVFIAQQKHVKCEEDLTTTYPSFYISRFQDHNISLHSLLTDHN